MAYVLRHHRTEEGSKGKLRHSTRQATVVSAESPSLRVMRMAQGQKVRALSQSHIAPADLRPSPPVLAWCKSTHLAPSTPI